MGKSAICIWMNIPSHHQRAFFSVLHEDAELEVKILYFNRLRPERIHEGWKSFALEPYEAFLPEGFAPESDMDEVLVDWRERIHVFSYCYRPDLADFLTHTRVPWVHWSDRGGVFLMKLVKNRMLPYRCLEKIYNWYKRKDGRVIQRNALGVFQTGRLTGKYFRAIGIDPERCENLFYAIQKPECAETDDGVRRFLRGRRAFLFVGSLYDLKGVRQLLRSLAALKNPDWALVFCGRDRSGGVYERMVGELGLGDRVYFAGTRASDRIGEIYAGCDMVVLPSFFDGWGMTLIEGAACGKALIGSDMSGAAHEIIRSGENGFLVPAGSETALLRAMNAYAENPALAAEHGQRSKEIFSQEFSLPNNVRRFKDALNKWQKTSN